MKLKVCGMKYPANILECATTSPDYLGFIFYDQSPRYFNGVIPKISEKIKKVGVFYNAPKADILKKVELHQLDLVQLHGDEPPELCDSMMKTGVEVIKTFSIKDTIDFGALKPYESSCSFFLFDTKGKNPGGNGYRFDWALLEDYPCSIPFFISGGIGLSEATDLKELKHRLPKLYAVDINSRFEVEPGVKDTKLIKQFMAQL